ncbi:MAG: tetratricopeptide repeat protein, partial [Blastocatellia bacterium]
MFRPISPTSLQQVFSRQTAHCSQALAIGLCLIANSLQGLPALEPDKPIEKTLAGGEAHGYRVALNADQFLRVTVDQRGIDVAVRFAGPDGKLLAEVNVAAGTTGLEPACWIAEAAGDYRVEVAAAEKLASRGRYQLRLAELRAATEADRGRVAAQRSFMQAERLFSDNKPEPRRQAIAEYAEAAQLWRAAGDAGPLAYALFNLGDLYRRSNDYPKALDHFNQAVELWRAAGDREGEAAALNAAGVVHAAMGDDVKAIGIYNQALPLRRQTGDREGEAVTLNAIAAATARLGERRKALGIYQQALSLRRETKDRRGEAVTLNNIALSYQVLGEKRKAISHFDQALQIWRALRESQSEANTLSNLGGVYSDLGDQQKALDAYNQALALWRAARNTRSEAVTLTNVGRAYDLLGAPREALNHYNRTLPVFRGIPDRRWEAITLNFAGLAHWSAGEYPRALDAFNQALPIRRELKDPAGEGATLNNLGLVYDSLGDRQRALETYNQALAILRAAGDRQSEAKTLNNIGFVYEALGETEKSLDHHNQALKLSRDVGDRMREAKVRYGIARIESRRNRLKQSRDQIEQTIKIVESLRVKLASPELRASYRASTQQYYDLYIDVLMRLGKRRPKSGLIAEALQASEQARARSLIELLAESGAEIREGVDAQLVGRERELQEQINDKTAEQIQSFGDGKKADQVAALSLEIEQLTIELRDVQSRIRRTSPRYAAITLPQPLTVREIQRKLLDANTVLLEYSLGEERSYLWAVTKTSLRGFTLPKREEIESKARRFYELLTARNQSIPNESGQKKQARLSNADAESREVAIELSRILLRPVFTQLGNRRLLIVADGAL